MDENAPRLKGKRRAYSAHYEDLLSRERLKDDLNALTADRKASWIEKGIAEAGASILGLDNVTDMKERGETRLTNKNNPATVLDSSTEVFYDPD